VLDTSTVILLPQITDASTLPAEPLITAVTLAELSVGPLVATTERERAKRTCSRRRPISTRCPSTLRQLAPSAVAISLRRAGRKPAARSYDAMIAATAVAKDLPIYTANPEDFRGIDGVDVVAVEVAVSRR
jgi:tRNA(fMet)-specific endonuclease VapC